MKKSNLVSAFRYLSLLLGVLVLTFSVACVRRTPTPSPDSGIQGQVTIGPTCPVVREGMDCADRPYQATLTVLTPNGKQVTQFQSGADGKFRLPLAPGNYILHPETPQGVALPRAAEQPFTVVAGSYTELNVPYDSGIR